MGTHLCPLCKSKLTEKHYHQVLGIYDARKKEQEALRLQLAYEKAASQKELQLLKQQQAKRSAELKAEQRRLREKQRDMQIKLQVDKRRLKEESRQAVQAARREAKRTLDAKVEQAVGRAGKQIDKLKLENDRLRRGQSLGDAGLQKEGEIYQLLKREFPNDDIRHTGKVGDVQHIVMHHKKPVGVIVYEVKDTQKLQAGHVKQTYDALRSLNADFGVLVTNGTRQGFSGFSIERNVILVRPAGLLAAAQFLRAHLIQVNDADLRASQKNVAGKKLIEYMSGKDFRDHMTTYIEVHQSLHGALGKEVKEHAKQWKERDAMHRKLFTATHLLKGSVANLLVGKSAVDLSAIVPPAMLELDR